STGPATARPSVGGGGRSGSQPSSTRAGGSKGGSGRRNATSNSRGGGASPAASVGGRSRQRGSGARPGGAAGASPLPRAGARRPPPLAPGPRGPAGQRSLARQIVNQIPARYRIGLLVAMAVAALFALLTLRERRRSVQA